MQNNQMLLGVIVVLALVVGVLAFDRHHTDDATLGQKVGNTIDRATGDRRD
jgi:hypothetical protein